MPRNSTTPPAIALQLTSVGNVRQNRVPARLGESQDKLGQRFLRWERRLGFQLQQSHGAGSQQPLNRQSARTRARAWSLARCRPHAASDSDALASSAELLRSRNAGAFEWIASMQQTVAPGLSELFARTLSSLALPRIGAETSLLAAGPRAPLRTAAELRPLWRRRTRQEPEAD
jgi:hypothetical protein